MDISDPALAEFRRLYTAALEAGNSPSLFYKAAAFAPEKWCDLATQIAKAGEEELALEHFRTALQVCQDSRIRSGVFNNLGLLLAGRGQMHEALASFEHARELLPGSASAYSNIALVHKWAGRLDEADRWIERALRIDPWFSEAQFIQSLIALLRGDYSRGFELYECRWRSRTNNMYKLETGCPEWDGSNGKRVFVYGEQGSGDVFLMLRYARMIRELGLWQAWVVKKGMRSLVESMGVIDCIVEDGDQMPQFDCHIPAASLPRLFKTEMHSIPTQPYFPRVAPLRVSAGLRRVGICWRGTKLQTNDRFRSTNLDQWKPVLDLDGLVEFHSLQVDGADEALFYPAVQMSEPPKDWKETAERIASMDLIITVDTSILHLAGAMGVPTWCALHCRPYFVYPLVRQDCPWYPSVRLFKQQKEWDWSPVFSQIANELRAFAAASVETPPTQIYEPHAVEMGMVPRAVV